MQQIYSILEIAGSGVKLLVGYLFQNDFFVLHALESTSAKLSKGQITDKSQMIICLKELMNSATKTLKLPLKEVILLLPPLNLSLGSEAGSTNSVSKEGIVTSFDVSNAFSIIGKKVKLPDKTIIDIVPFNFVYDDGQPNRFFSPNVVSNSLTVEADVSLIDKSIYDSFVEVVKGANLQILRTVLAPAAVISLLSSYNVAKQFLLVDIGASLTSLSLATDGRLLRSEVLSFGSEDITAILQDKLHVEPERADYLKTVFGLSDDPSFDFTFPEGFAVRDVRRAIEDSLEPLVDFIREYVAKFQIPEFYPIMMTGGGADLNNLDRFISGRFQTKVIIYTPEYFGARNKSYTNCVAVLKYIGLYPTIIQRRKGNDFTLTRVDSKIVDPKSSDDETEIL